MLFPDKGKIMNFLTLLVRCALALLFDARIGKLLALRLKQKKQQKQVSWICTNRYA